MTTARTSAVRRFLRPGRRTAVAVLTGAGIALTPLPALAAAPAETMAAAPVQVTAHSARAQTAVNTALAQQGAPYAWGGAGPDAFDCSGLTQFAYRAAGIHLPHSASAQSRMGTPVARHALKPGDLVFFHSPASHVGMYIGGGKMVHASTYGQPVNVVSVDAMPGFSGARRLA